MPSLTLRLEGGDALRELYEQQISKGRAFVPDAGGVREFEGCDLVLDHEGRTLVLRGEAVFVKAEGPGRGVGLQLCALDEHARSALRDFVEAANAPRAQDRAPDVDPPQDAAGSDRATRTLAERIRGLSTADQQRLAANGTMQERIILERTFGANVWETLLANPRLTIPEVARIARKGTLSRRMVEDIADHASWVAAPEVQRALLSNPRSTAAVASKVLRSLSRSDLQLVPQQTAYPQAVRATAKRMLSK